MRWFWRKAKPELLLDPAAQAFWAAIGRYEDPGGTSLHDWDKQVLSSWLVVAERPQAVRDALGKRIRRDEMQWARLTRFAGRVAVLGALTHDRSLPEVAAAVGALPGLSPWDYRDTLREAGRWWNAAVLVGADADAVFRRAAEQTSNCGRRVLLDFAARDPRDKGLNAWLLTADDFRGERAVRWLNRDCEEENRIIEEQVREWMRTHHPRSET